MSISGSITFNSIEDVKKAIREGKEVYVSYGRSRRNHSGILFWNQTCGYMRRFLGLTINHDFKKGRNNEPMVYFIK